MPSYFAGVSNAALQQVLYQASQGQGGPAAQQAGAASARADQTTPYATPSSYANVPLNQMGPYSAFGAWSNPTPEAQVSTGWTPMAQQPRSVTIAAIIDSLNNGKPIPSGSNPATWILNHLHQRQGLPTPTAAMLDPHVPVPGDFGSVRTPPPKGTFMPPISNPDVGLGSIASGVAGVFEGKGGKTPNSGKGNPGGSPGREGFPAGPINFPAAGPQPYDNNHPMTKNDGSSMLLHDDRTNSYVWVHKDGNAFIPDKHQDGTQPPGGEAGQPHPSTQHAVDNLNATMQDRQANQILKRLDPSYIPQAGQDPWQQIAKKLNVMPIQQGTVSTMKSGDMENALTAMSTDQIKSVQTQLWDAGFYDSRNFTFGNADTPTRQAWGAAIHMTSQLNADPSAKWKSVTVQDVLNSEKANVTALGGTEALITTRQPKLYTQATEQQMDLPTLSAFQARLGRGPTTAELQGVTAEMDKQQAAHAGNIQAGMPVFAGEGGVASVPGVTTPTGVAAQYAMTSAPNEYEGHSVANAYALFQNVLANKPVGVDPNITSAQRPL